VYTQPPSSSGLSKLGTLTQKSEHLCPPLYYITSFFLPIKTDKYSTHPPASECYFQLQPAAWLVLGMLSLYFLQNAHEVDFDAR
jgi:hypothetical protein